jgi:hypothetical protein
MLRFPVNQWLSPTRDGRQLFVELTYEPPRTHSPARNKRKREGN